MENGTTKKEWITPSVTELKPDLIKQQESEVLYYLLNSEDGLKLLSGAAS